MEYRKSVPFAGRYLNLTQTAREAGISPAHLCRILKGERQPSMSTLQRLKCALGMSTAELLDALETHLGVAA